MVNTEIQIAHPNLCGFQTGKRTKPLFFSRQDTLDTEDMTSLSFFHRLI